MLSKVVVAALALSSFVSAQGCGAITSTEAEAVKKAFNDFKITPNVIPAFEPKVRVDAAYGNTAVALGNNITTLG